MAKLKVAVCGTGMISQKKHLPSWKRQGNLLDVVAVCDLSLEAAQKAADRFSVPKAYNDLDELLDKEKPDIVDIVTPPKTHLPIAVQAMSKGAHVLIEKPMAMNVEECQQIVDASKQYQRKTCVSHTDLFYQSIIKARKMVDEGAIGDFMGMSIHLNSPTYDFHTDPDHWCHKLPGGVIGETGPHLIYLTMAWIKNISTIDVFAKKLMPQYPWAPFEDYRIIMEGDNGMSTAMATYYSLNFKALVELYGTDAMLLVDMETQSVVRYTRRKLKATSVGKSQMSEILQKTRNTVSVGTQKTLGQVPSTTDLLAEGFAKCVAENKPSPIPAEEGMECIRILKAVTDRIQEKYGVTTGGPEYAEQIARG